MPEGVPDDGLYHGPELDAAKDADGGPEQMGVCLTALASRRESFIDGQLAEAQKATAIVLGGKPAAGDEELAEVLLELKAAAEEALDEPLTDEQATLIAIRATIGGSWTYGMEIGLTLARQRQAQAAELDVVWDDQALPRVEGMLTRVDTRITMVEKVKL